MFAHSLTRETPPPISSPQRESLWLFEMWEIAPPWGSECMQVPCTALKIHYRVDPPPSPFPSPPTLLHTTVWVILWYVVTVKFQSVQVEAGETSRDPLVVQDVPYWTCYCKLHRSTACKRFFQVFEPYNNVSVLWCVLLPSIGPPPGLNYCSSSTVKLLVCGLLLSIACYYEDEK